MTARPFSRSPSRGRRRSPGPLSSASRADPSHPSCLRPFPGPQSSEVNAQPPTVLVVDDDQDTLDAMTMVLETAGVRVRTAASGFAAIDAVVAGLRPCLVLMDLRMPG